MIFNIYIYIYINFKEIILKTPVFKKAFNLPSNLAQVVIRRV